MEECPSLEHCFVKRRSLNDEHSTSRQHCGSLIMNIPLARGMFGTKGASKALKSDFMRHYTLFEAHSTYSEACFTIETFGARPLGSRHVLQIWRKVFSMRKHHVAWMTWSKTLNKE